MGGIRGKDPGSRSMDPEVSMTKTVSRGSGSEAGSSDLSSVDLATYVEFD